MNSEMFSDLKAFNSTKYFNNMGVIVSSNKVWVTFVGLLSDQKRDWSAIEALGARHEYRLR